MESRSIRGSVRPEDRVESKCNLHSGHGTGSKGGGVSVEGNDTIAKGRVNVPKFLFSASAWQDNEHLRPESSEDFRQSAHP